MWIWNVIRILWSSKRINYKFQCHYIYIFNPFYYFTLSIICYIYFHSIMAVLNSNNIVTCRNLFANYKKLRIFIENHKPSTICL